MKAINISEEQIERAKKLYTFGKLKGSKTKGKGINRTSVTYCSYGDLAMKPTDIWSNNIYDIFNPNGWKPKPMCFNGNTKCHHEAAPRGSKTGVQGKSGNYERSKIPKELCQEILKSTLNKFDYAV